MIIVKKNQNLKLPVAKERLGFSQNRPCQEEKTGVYWNCGMDLLKGYEAIWHQSRPCSPGLGAGVKTGEEKTRFRKPPAICGGKGTVVVGFGLMCLNGSHRVFISGRG